jgi:hypothetical protein
VGKWFQANGWECVIEMVKGKGFDPAKTVVGGEPQNLFHHIHDRVISFFVAQIIFFL